MDKEHKVSVYDMVKELNLKEVTPEINSREVYIEQAERKMLKMQKIFIIDLLGLEFQRSYFAETFIQVRCC